MQALRIENAPATLALANEKLIDVRALKAESRLTKFFSSLGPGLVAGASDDDPSGIGTYSMAGAQFGFSTLWTAIFALPLMGCVQYTCAKIGLVTGSGLTSILRKHYPRAVLYPAVAAPCIANIINAGADISAVAAACNLFLPVPAAVLVAAITICILLLQILGSYRVMAATFKWLTLALFAYVGTAFFVKLNPVVIATSTIRPEIKFDGAFLSMLVAILGTTISPYLFFWQTEQEVEEKITSGKRRLWQRRGASARLLKDRAIDVGCGMLLCSVVMYFIILSTGATLFQSGQHNITTAAEAAQALRPIAGPGATALFALGIVGSGLLAIPILTTSAAYTLCQTFGWRHGLSERFENAKAFYGAIILFTVLGASLNCFGINPIQALLWAAIINGVVAPPLLILITMIANNKKIMGTHTNGPLNNAFCFLAIGVMSAAAIAMFVLFKTDPTTEAMILQTLPKTAMSTNSHF